MLESVLRLVLSNLTLTCLALGLIASGVALIRRPRPWPVGTGVEALVAWLLVFSIGVSFVYNFAPGNAGTIFYTDLLIPAIGFALLWATRPPRETGSTDRSRAASSRTGGGPGAGAQPHALRRCRH
jgi:hypothetical protein